MKIAIIGCGNMGKALAQALSSEHQLFLYDRDRHFDSTVEVDMIILAVKPQNLMEVADSMQGLMREGQILVSILAGIPIETLKVCFPVGRVVRMMPNLAVMYGEGIVGISSEEEFDTSVFRSLGKILWLPQEKMDALTALGGSGPAFFFVMIEAMIDAGIAMGFTAKDAQELTYQMIKGSLALLEKTSSHPAELKWQIASPGGTTIAGLKKLEEGAIRAHIMNAFLAALARASEVRSPSHKPSSSQIV